MRVFLGFFLLSCISLFSVSESVKGVKAGEGLMTDDKIRENKRPNILFVISDDQSFPHASIYGQNWIDTPVFDSIAKKGMLFTNAFSASPGCSPSRAAILTGFNAWQIKDAGTHDSGFPLDYKVYPDILEELGYKVGYTGKGWGPGNWLESGRKRNPAGDEFNNRKLEPPTTGISTNDYSGNFNDFLAEGDPESPFCFWFGAREPHRPFERGSGLKSGKNPEDVTVPDFLPDVKQVREDLLDYALEIEWFDSELGKMLKRLEELGELSNTIVVVTSDNGMPFPRAKANTYEYGIHVPLAIMWKDRIPSGRIIETPVSLIDLAPTFLEAATDSETIKSRKLYPMEGKSLLNLLLNFPVKNGYSRDAVFASRERHSSSRWGNLTYPQRAIRTQDFLYIQNIKPERWPAGAPQKYNSDGSLGPMHDAYHDIDGSPTFDYMVTHRSDFKILPFFNLAVAKRPDEELYDIKNDPFCLVNLVSDSDYAPEVLELKKALTNYLIETGDPRATGNGAVYENYIRYSQIRKFPIPDWAKRDSLVKLIPEGIRD